MHGFSNYKKRTDFLFLRDYGICVASILGGLISAMHTDLPLCSVQMKKMPEDPALKMISEPCP